MPPPDGARFGDAFDRVTLSLGGSDVSVVESYQIAISYFVQPARFSLRIGQSASIRDLLRLYTPGKKFQLRIGGALQQTGYVTGRAVDEVGEGASALTVRGVDVMGHILNKDVRVEKSYQIASYEDLVRQVLQDAGHADVPVSTDNAAARQIQSGIPARRRAEPGSKASPSRTVRAKLGEKRVEIINRHFRRAGLFLTTSPDGGLVISVPNTKQAPMARIWRGRGAPRGQNTVSVRLGGYDEDTADRPSECVVYTRHRKRKFSQGTVNAVAVDDEMVAYGIERPLAIRSHQCESFEQAELLAERKLAEARRASWALAYIAPGHSTYSPQGRRVVWAPDTMVDVQDDELGISGPLWVESVIHRFGPPSETMVQLMRPADLPKGADLES